MDPETKELGERSVRLQEPFCFSLIVYLPQLILTFYFANRQFLKSGNIWEL